VTDGAAGYVVALLLAALLFMCLLGAGAIMLPLFMQTVLDTGTFVSGLAVLPGGLLLGLLGRPVGALYDKIGARPLVIPGAAAMALSMWLFATLGPESPLAAVIAIHLVMMGGLGLMMSPLMTEALSALPGSLYSHGSAILTTLQQVAGALGTALFVTVAALASSTAASVPDADGLRAAFIVGGVVGVLALVTSLSVRRRAADPEGANSGA
jgi:MFS transporter, DHA2 family, lincomycin resistance protein